MNTKINLFLAATICAATLSCQDDISNAISDPADLQETTQDAVVPGVLRLKVSEDQAAIWLAARDEDGNVTDFDKSIFPDIDVTSIRTTFHVGGKFESRQRESGLHLWFDVEYQGQILATKATDILTTMPQVQISEPIYKIKTAEVEMDDPYYSEYQWHYNNKGDNGFTEGIDIGLIDAWERFGVYGNSEVIVAVVDSGVEYSHEDLNANMWVNEAELNGIEGVDDDGNGYKDDIHGYNFAGGSAVINADSHGTHVAGTIAAVNNNGIGVSGVAGGRYPDIPGVRMMTLQVIDDNYPTAASNLVQVYQYAAENGAVILNNSWGYQQALKVMPAADKDAIDYFTKYAGLDENGNQVGPMKGGLSIFAAGNDAEDLCYPAAYEGVIAVASVGPTGKAAYYTNYGDWVDVCAPGGDHKVDAKYGGIYSTGTNNTYVSKQGTSMACPHVTGIAALVLSANGGPGYLRQDLWDSIIDAADPFIYDYNADMQGMLGKGLVNATLALSTMNTIAPDNVTYLTGEVNSNTIYLTADVPADDTGDAYYYHAFLSEDEIDMDNLSACTRFDIAISKQETTEEGYKRFALTGLDFETTYNIAVLAGDFAGNMSSEPYMLKLTTKANSLPEIKATTVGKSELKPKESTTYAFVASDPDDFHTLTCVFDEGNTKGVIFDRLADGSYFVKINASTMDEGDYKCVFSASDQYGAKSEYEIKFSIIGNTAPELRKAIPDVKILGVGETAVVNLSEYFADADGETLSYTASVDKNAMLELAVNGQNLSIKSNEIGTAQVSVVAKDAAGEQVSAKFTVTVRDASRPYDLYPNPVVDVLNILPAQAQKANIRLYSSTGRTVYDESAEMSDTEAYKADLSKLAPGMYTLSIEQEGGTKYATSIVKL